MVYDSTDNKTYERGYNSSLEHCNYNHEVDVDLLVVPRTLKESNIQEVHQVRYELHHE